MDKLIFKKEKEIEIPERPDYKNIFSGKFTFATQNTAVYQEFSLINTGTEIMKINTSCDRIFFRDNKIAILNEQVLTVYEEMKEVKKITLPGSHNLRDLFLTDLEKKEEDKEVCFIDDDTDIFLIEDSEMVVNKENVVFKGKVHKNEIHEPDSEYFVAWKNNIAILGNSKSLNFMYFEDDDLVEPDDYYRVSLRIDEDLFEPIYLKDLKFWNNKLLAIDDKMFTIFSFNKITAEENELTLVEYKIEDDSIIEVKREASNTDEVKELIKENEDLSKAIENSVKENQKLSKSIDELMKEEEKTTKSDGSLLKKDDLLSKVSDFSFKDEKSPIKSTGDLFKTTSLLEKNKESDLKPINFDSIKSLQEEKPPTKSIFSNKGADAISLSDLNKSLEKKSSPETPIKKVEKSKEEKEMEDFDKTFCSRIEALKSVFSKVGKTKSKLQDLVFTPSNFNFESIYNTIFHNKIEDYESILSSMIMKIENMQVLSEKNIQECIKYFDSKIFSKKDHCFPVLYKDPLCSRMNEVLQIKDPFDDILEGIKFLDVQKKPQKVEFVQSSNTDSKFETSAIKKNPMSFSTQNDDKIKSDDKNNIPENSFSKTQVNQEDPLNRNDLLTQTTASSSNPPSFFTTPLPANPNNPLSGNQLENQLPKPVFSNDQQTGALFNNPIQNINNSIFSNDSSSIFNNITANSSQSLFTATNPAANNQQKDDNSMSAFNRLAGSRRLFQ